MAILYVAAEAAELKPFAARLTGLRKLKWPVDYAQEGIWEGRRVMLAANGAGPKLAAQAVEIAIRAVSASQLESSRLEAVVSVGFCAALCSDLLHNQIVVATGVIDPASAETFPANPVQTSLPHATGPIISQDCVAVTADDKARLQPSGALAVDMESSGVAARATRAELPFFAVKVVSDLASETLPIDFNRLRTQEGRLARGKIVLHALSHPHLLGSLLQLKRRSDDAARALGDFLVSCKFEFESRLSAAE